LSKQSKTGNAKLAVTPKHKAEVKKKQKQSTKGSSQPKSGGSRNAVGRILGDVDYVNFMAGRRKAMNEALKIQQ
jgi:hypothetical protein